MDDKKQVEQVFTLVLIAASIMAKHTWPVEFAKQIAKEILSDEEKPRGV